MLNNVSCRVLLICTILIPTFVPAMGLRSFVALPVDKDGVVLRSLSEYNDDTDANQLTTNMAFGLDHRQTILLNAPYRLSPSGSDRLGDVSVLYRNIIFQNDQFDSTLRLGLLGGLVVPTDSDRDAALPLGFVTTYYKGRNELDLDALYQIGLSDRKDSGRYDVSWQYRLIPEEYPDWGIGSELNSVIELRGNWNEDDKTIHELTLGLQWIHQTWVVEGGAIRDLNGPDETRYLLSVRLHF